MPTYTDGINAVVSLDAAGGTSFTEVGSTEGWSTSHTRQQAIATPSSNGGGEIGTAGVADWSGSFNYVGADFALYPGQTGKFLGYNGNKSVTGLIIVESATFNWDHAGGTNMGGVVNFLGNGAIDYVATTDADATDPTVYNSVGIIRLDWKPVGQGSYATLEGLENMSLTIGRRISVSYPRDTSPWPNRTPGGFYGSLNFSMVNSNLEYIETTANAFVPGTFGYARAYVSATAYFDIAFMQVLNVDTSTAPNQQARLTGSMGLSLGTPISGTWTEGYFIKPSGLTTWFGVTGA